MVNDPVSAQILGAALYGLRTSALVLGSPSLGSRIGMGSFKIAIIASLSLVCWSASGSPPLDADVLRGGAPMFVALAGREIAIGLFLSFLGQLVLVAARVSGEMIGLEMGMQMAQQVDPESGASMPLMARMQEELYLVGFLIAGGHLLIVRSLVESFERAPAGRGRLDLGAAEFAAEMLSEMFASGIAFAMPILGCMVLVTCALGLIARTVSQINVLELGFTLRIALALIAMAIFLPLMEPAFTGLFGSFSEWTGRGLDLLEVSVS